MTIEQEVRAMFDARQEKELATLKQTNQELKPLIENSNRILKGMIDVGTLTPPSVQAQ